MVIRWVRTCHLILSHTTSSGFSLSFVSWYIAKNMAKHSASSVCQVQVSVGRMGLFWELSLGLLLLSLELDWHVVWDKQGLVQTSESLNSDFLWPTEERERECYLSLGYASAFLIFRVCNGSLKSQQVFKSFCRHLKLVVVCSQQILKTSTCTSKPCIYRHRVTQKILW